MSKLRIFLEMIKFEHTIFALPFAYAGALLASRGRATAWQIVWITLAMVGARTAAMAFNRLADAELDAKNPRTMGRARSSAIRGMGRRCRCRCGICARMA